MYWVSTETSGAASRSGRAGKTQTRPLQRRGFESSRCRALLARPTPAGAGRRSVAVRSNQGREDRTNGAALIMRAGQPLHLARGLFTLIGQRVDVVAAALDHELASVAVAVFNVVERDALGQQYR